MKLLSYPIKLLTQSPAFQCRCCCCFSWSSIWCLSQPCSPHSAVGTAEWGQHWKWGPGSHWPGLTAGLACDQLLLTSAPHRCIFTFWITFEFFHSCISSFRSTQIYLQIHCKNVVHLYSKNAVDLKGEKAFIFLETKYINKFWKDKGKLHYSHEGKVLCRQNKSQLL